MKKNVFAVMVLSLFIFACSDDDTTVPDLPTDPPVDSPTDGGDTGAANFVFTEVEYLGDRIELFNAGDAAASLADYFLCLGPGTYAQIGNLETEGDVNLGAGEYLTVFYEMPVQEGGLALYSSNQFTSAEAIVDFVQWGAGESARENVAVEAGIWTAGDFITVLNNESNTIIFDGEGNAAADWSETSTPTFGAENVFTMPEQMRRSIVFNEVQFGNLDQVELYNNGDVTIDLSDYWLCLGPGRYAQIGNLTPVSGTIELASGEFLVLPFDMDDADGLGLYSTNTFASAEAILDFVQWGEAGSPRENVAAEAGIWTAGDFVPSVGPSASIEYDGEGDAASDWTEEAIPSLGEANDAAARTTVFNVTISNVTNYLNVAVFNTPLGTDTPRPLENVGEQYQIDFQAVPGTNLSLVTMMGNSNDWFLAPEDFGGIPLWQNGAALNGVDIADQFILYDLGTEADNDPASFPPAGANVGAEDPNTATRIVDRNGNRGDTYMTAVLDYAPGDGNSAGTFTLTITRLADNFVVTPGLAVLHTLENPFFTLGEEDRGVGLEAIAEDGNPMPLYNWFRETGSTGAPLRLASSLSVFSPGLVYAFNGERDPLVLQGETNSPNNGLEALAEDGNNAEAVAYLENLGLPVAASNETENIGPGETLTFSLEVPQDQNFKFSFASMLVQTNDWFMSYNNMGFPLFDDAGNPVSGTGASERSYLYDAGTEVDEAVGFGANQAPRQTGPDQGAEDGDTLVRRVGAIEDVQFGKGVIESAAGVIWLQDPRGGYNIIRVDIQPQ